MSAKRIQMHRLQEMVRLHRMNIGARKIARQLKMSPNTEREYRRALLPLGFLDGDPDDLPSLTVLREAVQSTIPSKEPHQQASSITHLRPTIERLLEKGASPTAIYDRLRADDENFNASRWAVGRMCKRIRKERGVQPTDVAIPVETIPGQVAQVDFGFVGRLWDPQSQSLRKAWVFVMVLGHSRHMFARVVFDQRTETWLWLHALAFEFFGGATAVSVPDNLKAAVIRRAFGLDDDTALNRSYRELARHYRMQVDPTPVYDPKKKGKVERSVKYVKNNFFKTNEKTNIDDVNADLEQWVIKIAGRRQHGTTGLVPIEVFVEEEQPALNALPARAFAAVVYKQCRVYDDSHVSFGGRLYSVPWKLLGKTLWVRATADVIDIFDDIDRVAHHRRRGDGYRSTRDHHLPRYRVDHRHRDPDYWRQRAARIGDDVLDHINDIFDSDDVLLQLRTVIATVKLLEEYPSERARAACRRARLYGNLSVGGMKRILRLGLDLQPPDGALAPAHGHLVAPRFSRVPVVFPLPDGDHDECH